jgi:uncharacterized protein YbcV (DUF1398 family)
MFTINQIKEAHAKVKSGTDFPRYVQDIIKIGVTGYETFVSDGHTLYFGKDGYKIESNASYEKLEVKDHADMVQFQHDLKATQQGKTDFPTFCRDCARSGVEKWVTDLSRMTCTYYDKAGSQLLVETIPIP